jgi:hypothetical protein
LCLAVLITILDREQAQVRLLASSAGSLLPEPWGEQGLTWTKSWLSTPTNKTLVIRRAEAPAGRMRDLLKP